jgi:glycosyltransferase involved in cell wall biosynthesis
MRIAYVQYTNPEAYPPLEHSSRILAGAGWQVMFLGTGAFGSNPLRFPPHPNVSVKRLRFCPAGVRQKVHYAVYCLWVIGWVMLWRPDWIYASDPLACPVALVLSFVPRLRVLYHEHDSPGSAPTTVSRKVGLWIRRRVARRACCSVLPNEARAERYRSDTETTRPVLCVWNCPRRDEVSGSRASTMSRDVWVHYHGSLGPTLLPLDVLRALALLPDRVRLRVIGYETAGTTGYAQVLSETAHALGVSHRVSISGPLPRFELLQLCRQSDIGLALMPKDDHNINMCALVGASNKAFDYLASGLPVLVSNLPDWEAMFVEPGYGASCIPSDLATIERALRSLIESPAEMRAMGERGRRRVSREWNYETQFAKVLECLNNDPTRHNVCAARVPDIS